MYERDYDIYMDFCYGGVWVNQRFYDNKDNNTFEIYNGYFVDNNHPHMPV
jgi:hypothetical protein